VKIEESVEKDGETSEIEKLHGSDHPTTGTDAVTILNDMTINYREGRGPQYWSPTRQSGSNLAQSGFISAQSTFDPSRFSPSRATLCQQREAYRHIL
jgi:hypothetical protein